MDDGITILEEPAALTTIVEVEGGAIPAQWLAVQHPASKTSEVVVKDEINPVMVPTITEVAPPSRFMDRDVYAEAGNIYWKEDGSRFQRLAFTNYCCDGANRTYKPAFTTLHNGKTVFCSTQDDLDVFLKLAEKVDIEIGDEYLALAFFKVNRGNVSLNSYNKAMAVMSFDGETIEWRSSSGRVYPIALSKPIQQLPEKIFDDISRFLSLSVKGVKADLQLETLALAELAGKRAEEIFLYVSDVTPPVEKQELHASIVAHLEKSYVDDAPVLTASRRKREEMLRTIKMTKSQLPAGRKGKPMRLSYLTSPIITELLDWFCINRSGNSLTFTFAFKDDLFLEEEDVNEDSDEDGDRRTYTIEYGRPVIEVFMMANKQGGREGTFIRRVEATSRDYKAFVHPHLDGQRNWCLGTYITPLNNALVGGNIPLAVSLIWQYLNRFNADSPLVSLSACAEVMGTARKNSIIVRRK